MANRFDSIPQFNPYIQEYPIEMLSQVGLLKQHSYDEGVQKVQGLVDKIAGLDVIKNEDKQLLQQKLQGMGNDISKLSSQDFSNPLLVGQIGSLAGKVYNDPGLQNAIMGTAEVRKKQSSIKDLRDKHPENYNQFNEAYAMLDVNKWLTDGQAGSKLSDNKSYSDYYDYSKEVRDVMKDFKPSRLRTKLVNGEWLVLNEDQSWTENEVKKYIAGTLSDRAKQQMRIESVVSFSGNDNALLAAHVENLRQNKSANEKLIKKLESSSSIITDPEKREAYKTEITNALNENSEIDSQLIKMRNNDLSFFNAYKENIAENLFKNKYIDNLAKGYSHPNLTTEYSPNAVWQAKFIQSMENSRLNARMQFDAGQNALDRDQAKDLKFLELGYKSITKGGKIQDNQNDHEMVKSQPNVTKEAEHISGREEFDNAYKNLQIADNENYLLLRKKLLAANSELKRNYLNFVTAGGKDHSSSDPADIATLAYVRDQIHQPSQNRDQWLNDYIEKVNYITTQRAILDQKKQEIDDEITMQYGADILKSKQTIDKIPTIDLPVFESISTISRGGNQHKGYNILGHQTITAKDYMNYLLSTDNDNKASKAIIATIGSLYDSNYPQITKAKDDINRYGQELIAKLGGRQKIDRLKSALEYETKLYNQSTLNMGDWWTPVADKDPRVKTAVNYVQRQVGGTPDEFTVARANKTTGEIQLKISPLKNSTINTSLMESLGYIYDKANDSYTIKSLPYFKRDVSELTSTENALAGSLDANVNIPQVGYYTPAHIYDPNSNGQFIQIVKDVSPSGGFRYYLKHENSGVTLDLPGMDMVDPISAIKAAKALTADTKVLQDIIRKKQPNYIVK